MIFQIDVASRVPIYRQLAQQIREGVARGKLAADERLPSVRELSRTLVINPNTVARVYTELERDGVLNTRPGLGVFVAQPRNDLTRRARKDRLATLADQLLTEAVHLGFSAQEVLSLVTERIAKFQFPESVASE
ncbi:GntR family transcriptional regulator [Anatilimnocola floriformis]|uniref:GntR family transcriptional regulator n=1 Tax=Anatilimnocola floriformis TaxID=2948575 RepID=UPI0020C5B1AD|nr:GntR family transcriptional regulator [Anatilimnocola floriformis]